MPVSQPCQLSQARFRPQFAVKPLGLHGLVHEINQRPPLPATTPLHETNIRIRGGDDRPQPGFKLHCAFALLTDHAQLMVAPQSDHL
jgi:hypothetical protein